MAFAQFERERVDRGAPPLRTIHAFVDGGDASVAAGFIEWLQAHPASLQQALDRLVPAAVREAVGVDSWAWVERLVEADESGFGGWLTDVVQQARSDFDELARLEVEASEARQHRRAEHFARTRRTLEERRLIDQFAQRGVLPKYGFPVDVVDLDVSRSEDGRLLELNRDLRLGILEFAPGAKVVAANKLWTS
ncbi:MAG: hypothetical protein KDB16_14100, partial [Acidimicrobiales bacterium]|nr:hypothetical protein [Acidimicrobiales bacterium]